MAYWPRLACCIILAAASAAEPLRESDWSANWIRAAASPEVPASLPLLRREFRVDKRVKRAIVYVSGLGQYELHLNGSKIGEAELTPAWSDYRKTVLYNSFDVSAQLRRGQNVFGVMLGNGIYNVPQTKERFTQFRRSRGEPKLLLQAQIQYADGTAQRIISDHQWRTIQGPIMFSSPYGGEDYDARLELSGWDEPGFREKNWLEAQETEGPGGRLELQAETPIRISEKLTVAHIGEPQPGIKVYDFGRVIEGWPEISVMGPRGSAVRLIGGQLLDRDGFASQRLSGGPQWFSYTLRGAGVETWWPRFSSWKFRYVQVELQGDYGVFPQLVSIKADSLTQGMTQIRDDD